MNCVQLKALRKTNGGLLPGLWRYIAGGLWFLEEHHKSAKLTIMIAGCIIFAFLQRLYKHNTLSYSTLKQWLFKTTRHRINVRTLQGIREIFLHLFFTTVCYLRHAPVTKSTSSFT